jgi:hypothetical protein
MTILILFLLSLIALVPATWLLFLGIMSLQRARDAGTLSKTVTYIAEVVLLVGYLFDFALNFFVGTFLFMELPKEFLLSPRVARLKKTGTGYRQIVASWICTNLLDPFDPSGCHCK